jgi:hypothetical protein
VIGSKRRALRLNVAKYCLMEGGLGWRNLDGFILRHVDFLESQMLMNEMHNGLCAGHFTTKTTTHKILRVGYY